RKVYLASLENKQPSDYRLVLIFSLDEASRASEGTLAAEKAAVNGWNRGIEQILSGQERQEVAQTQVALDVFRAQIRDMVSDDVLREMLYTYREASDVELRAYVEFLESDAGKWFLKTVYQGPQAVGEQVDGALLHLLQKLGSDDGGSDGVHENPPGAHFLGERLGQPDDARLGGGVGHEGRIAFLAGDGGDVDDASGALPEHDPDGSPAAQEDAREVDVDHAPPVLVGQLPDGKGAARDAGVVHEDVEPAPLLGDAAHRGIDLRRLGHVGGDDHRPRPDLARGHLRLL